MDCPICFETIHHNNIITTICNHKFCKTCLDKWKNTTNSKNKCPICRKNLNRYITVIVPETFHFNYRENITHTNNIQNLNIITILNNRHKKFIFLCAIFIFIVLLISFIIIIT